MSESNINMEFPTNAGSWLAETVSHRRPVSVRPVEAYQQWEAACSIV